MASFIAMLFVAFTFCMNAVIAFPVYWDWTDWPTRNISLSVKHLGPLKPIINATFPDPSFVQANATTWVAFATTGRGKNIQVATSSDPLGEWNLLQDDALPEQGWTMGGNFWAPDVRKLDNGVFIMYFSAKSREEGTHCIGAARSNNPLGPYKMDEKPFICPTSQGGAIDPMGIKDCKTGQRWLTYKIDGNKAGGNSSTPLILQEVKPDGVTTIGGPVTIMERTKDDGPLVEAPDLVQLSNGMYVLFFSSHWYNDAAYDVKYAYSKNIKGPYVRAQEPLLKAPDFGLMGPGGATSDEQGSMIVFHGLCGGGRRCMYAAPYDVTSASIFGGNPTSV